MTKRLLGVDPLTGLRTYHEYDWKDKKTTISYEHNDVSPVLKWNSDRVDAGMVNTQKKDMMWHAATVPEITIIQWRLEGIDIFKEEHWPMVRKKLNDPDNKYLRTWRGRI